MSRGLTLDVFQVISIALFQPQDSGLKLELKSVMIKTVYPEQGSYKILECLGEGSMGIVYRARRRTSFGDRVFALKVLKNETMILDFRAELEALFKIRSQHCVSVYGWEVINGKPALVLEWIDGINLFELHRHLNLSEEEIQEIGRQVQAGLQHLEASGVCHGDISPRNILVDQSGNVSLVDFGLAAFSSPGAVVGTMPYLSPERWLGQPPCLGDDYFALGLLLEDLKKGSLNFLGDADTCKTRIKEVMTLKPGLLCKNANQRKEHIFEVKPEAKKNLGKRVRCILEARKNLSSTQQIKTIFKKNLSLRIGTLLMIFLFFIPHSPGGVVWTSYLEVRTQHWFHLWVDGRDMGFTPLRVSILEGRHFITWESQYRSGTITLMVEKGRSYTLTDSNF